MNGQLSKLIAEKVTTHSKCRFLEKYSWQLLPLAFSNLHGNEDSELVHQWEEPGKQTIDQDESDPDILRPFQCI